MRPDLARLTEEERAILTRWEMATKEPRAHIATVLKGYALDDIPVALASIADLRADRDALAGKVETLREHLQLIANQPCERAPGHVRFDDCSASGDCITEWCLTCYARAALEPKP